MRVAWMGPAPSNADGVSYVATQLLKGLSRSGVELDCFIAAPESALPDSLGQEPCLRLVCKPSAWKSGKWYSRTPLASFAGGQLARAVAQARLASEIARQHAARPYDLFYQFSQIELGWVRRLRGQLPPIVLHPEAYAAGELEWHRREAALARECEPRVWHLAVRGMLATRAWTQRRDAQLAHMIIAPSRQFAEDLAADYQLPLERLRVVPNPIDMQRFAPPVGSARDRQNPLTLLFISRMSVRKGVEMIIALSHRLADLSGQVRIHMVGDRTLWSDYRPLLSKLNARTATYIGPSPPTRVSELYRSADGLINPAHHEPFGLTVGEALACGLPVVVSDRIGAAEDVDARCCQVFPAGDISALEGAVRELVAKLRAGSGDKLRLLARTEAERLFSPSTVASEMVEHLELAVRARQPALS